jgi:hypothetical protein
MKKTLEIVGPVMALVSGLLALVNQSYDVFWSFDYAPELLLALCCLGLMAYGTRLLLRRPSKKMPQSRFRYAGFALIVLAPVAGILFWSYTMRLSPENRQVFEGHRLKAEAYEEIGYRDDAIREYEAASRIAPSKGSIKQKLRDLRANQRSNQKE